MTEDTNVNVMSYVDFKLTVDTEPDINGCMWVTMKRWNTGEQTWDMDADCVSRLHDACSKFLDRFDAIQHEEAA